MNAFHSFDLKIQLAALLIRATHAVKRDAIFLVHHVDNNFHVVDGALFKWNLDVAFFVQTRDASACSDIARLGRRQCHMLIIGDGDGHLGRLAITNAELDVVQYQMASIAAFVTNLRSENKVCIGGSGIVQVVIGQLRQNGRGEGVNLRCATFRHHRISQVVHKQPDVGIATNIFHLVAFHYGIGFIARGQRVAVAAGKGGAQVVERAHSSAQLKQQKMILSKKQELIEQVMGKAKETILSQSDSDYFEMIKKMVSRFKLPEPGVISFAKKDLDRLPSGLQESIKEAVGTDVEVSDKPADIDGGFVLSYGGIEENCSIDAIFRSEREGLQDCISDILFKN